MRYSDLHICLFYTFVYSKSLCYGDRNPKFDYNYMGS